MVNRIETGKHEFTGERLLDGALCIGNSLACDELGWDTLEATLDGSEELPTLFQPADADRLLTSEDQLFGVRPYFRLLVDDLTQYRYGEPVSYYHDGLLLGKFFMASAKRVGRYTYAISCTSAVGLLDGSTHYGGIYTGQVLSEVLADIMGGMAAYTLDEALKNVPVYGWLPVATRRANLHQLLFSVGASVRKDAAGDLVLTTLDAQAPAPLADDRLFLGGDVQYPAPATKAEVAEHTYLSYSGDERVTLYEGDVVGEGLTSPKGASLSGTLVLFDGPMHGLEVANGVILEQGVNYAVLGQGLSCQLTGQKYTHTTRIVTAEPRNTRSLAELQDNTVRVTEATLVSMANSENVAARVLAAWSATRTIKTDMVVGSERPGDYVSLTDPFGDPANGLIKSMEVSVSGLLRATAEIVVGYTPTGSGNYYNHADTLTEDGTWTVPEGVTKVRLALIGGGQGGSSGGAGHAGVNGQITSRSDSEMENFHYTFKEHLKGFCGDGGEEGTGGHGGRVYLVTLDVTPGQVLRFNIGRGGAGGDLSGSATTHHAGAEGTATTCGGHSSDQGSYSPYGYTNLFTGEVLAQSGGKGVRGGRGAGDKQSGKEYLSGNSVSIGGVTYRQGADGFDDSATRAYEWGNGAGGPKDSLRAASTGGEGGGPAAGAGGGKGYSSTASAGQYFARARIGYGGTGATPTIIPPTPAVPGAGGGGGHGGGGGGAPGYGGVSYRRANAATGPSGIISVVAESGGSSPGQGGKGGNGAPGCVVIYY